MVCCPVMKSVIWATQWASVTSLHFVLLLLFLLQYLGLCPIYIRPVESHSGASENIIAGALSPPPHSVS